MLRILRLPYRGAVAPLVETFDPREAAWIVSDLRSKFELQTRLLDKYGGYLDQDVLRASDLWKTLLKRIAPGVRLISRDFARSMVRSFLHTHQETLGLKMISENAVLSAMDRFAGVVFHPEGIATVSELFAENADAALRWGVNFQLARLALNHLASQKMLTAKWVAASLQMQGESELARVWQKPLIVDLGAELTGAEAQLFLQLSRTVDVTLLQPFPDWRNEAEGLLRPYGDVEGFAAEIVPVETCVPVAAHFRTMRFSGQLAETKAAVSQTRRWLDAGIAPARIAILAPEIEDYWPVLKSYLDQEGVPCEKPVTTKLNSFPGVSRWLSRLRPKCGEVGRDAKGEVNSDDLELSFYADDSLPRLRYEEFRSLFANLYGEEDLARNASVAKFFSEGPQFRPIMSRDNFLLSAVQLWDARQNLAPLMLIGREIMQNALGDLELPIGEWAHYLESIAAAKEATIEEGSDGGITVTNLISARNSQTTHRIFLGLSEEGLKKAERNPLPLKDLRDLSQLGFHLDHPDQSLLEFELRWVAEAGAEEDLYFVGNSTFEGSVRAPSSLWLRMNRERAHSETLDLPGDTRWDALQQSPPSVWRSERGWSETEAAGMLDRLGRDLGTIAEPAVVAPLPKKISPSLVKNYLECPFIVAGTSLFRLKDLAEVDLDMAHTEKGSLTHGVFQRLTDEGWLDRKASPEELSKLIESVRDEQKFTLGEEKLWGPYLKRQVRVAAEFLRVEKEWREKFPLMRLLPSESTWNIWFDATTGTFQTEETPDALRITGRIDRLETDGDGNYVVVDYKASAAKISDQHQWLDKNELQLLFYLWAVEKGALAGIRGRAVGAFYYVYKDFSRHRGMQIDDQAGRLFTAAPSTRKNLGVDDARKQELFAELEKRIRQVVADMQKGRWMPDPVDEEICGYCPWNGLCRAPHLN